MLLNTWPASSRLLLPAALPSTHFHLGCLSLYARSLLIPCSEMLSTVYLLIRLENNIFSTTLSWHASFPSSVSVLKAQVCWVSRFCVLFRTYVSLTFIRHFWARTMSHLLLYPPDLTHCLAYTGTLHLLNKWTNSTLYYFHLLQTEPGDSHWVHWKSQACTKVFKKS